ncbi:MAG: bis(5'-nucleosyl)-tetraphosphatase (symmetrical) YqeK [Lachnospiraceae bacterium]|nr:bis(5'-nucleosyl)-tetraphosphatase (symmetrical) YqeK [Lachnospiraceae bacterium]
MERETIHSLRKQLKKNLSKHRYEHTLGVAYTAACLAMRYGADIYKAEVAGLLHDCAKEYTTEELRKMAGDDYVSEKTLHAVCAPIVAEEKYGIKDQEILSAVRWHTTGKANMALLDKIIFVADFIEPARKMITILPDIRRLAFEDLTYSVYKISKETIPYILMMKLPMDKNTVECYEWLKENGIHDKD